MKHPLLMAGLCIALTAVSNAQPPQGNANPGDIYGASFDKGAAVEIKEILSSVSADKPIQKKIKAKVLDVCPKKGCWMQLEVNDTLSAFLKMKDYGFFVPLATKGKTVVLDAEISEMITSVKELKHYAADAKKSKEEIDAIKKPKSEIRVIASGIEVL